MKNNTDCPSFFAWNGYQYLVVGFTGYYRTLSPDSNEFFEMAGKEEFYDGLCVPMICKYENDRYIMGGWIEAGWGSVIIHRELVQEAGGRLGMKWLPEMIPQTLVENLAADGEIEFEDNESYLLEMTVDPGAAERFALQFADGERAAEFAIDLKTCRMQMNDTVWGEPAEAIPTAYEQTVKDDILPRKPGPDVARGTCNFSMAGVDCCDKPFTLRVLIRESHKLHATVMDFEIAGCRTLISRRDWFYPKKAQIVSNGNIKITDLSLKRLADRVK